MKKLVLVLAIVVFLAGTALGEEGSYVNDAAHQEKMFWQIVEEAPLGYFVKVPRTGRYVFVTVEPCPNPTQVTAYKASDGRLFETREGLAEHEARLQNKQHDALCELFKLDYWYDEDLNVYLGMSRSIYLIIKNYPEIKDIMEGEKWDRK